MKNPLSQTTPSLSFHRMMYSMVLKSQLPHKIVDLLFAITNYLGLGALVAQGVHHRPAKRGYIYVNRINDVCVCQNERWSQTNNQQSNFVTLTEILIMLLLIQKMGLLNAAGIGGVCQLCGTASTFVSGEPQANAPPLGPYRRSLPRVLGGS